MNATKLLLSGVIFGLGLASCKSAPGERENPIELGRGVFASGAIRPGHSVWTDILIDEETLLIVSVQPPLEQLDVDAYWRVADPQNPGRTKRERAGIVGAPHFGTPPVQAQAEHRDLWLTPGLYTLRIGAAVASKTPITFDLSFEDPPRVERVEPQRVVFHGSDPNARARVRLAGYGMRPDFRVKVGEEERPAISLDRGAALLFEVRNSEASTEKWQLSLETPWRSVPLDTSLRIEKRSEPRRRMIAGMAFRELPAGVAVLGPSSEGVGTLAEDDPLVEEDEGARRSYGHGRDVWIGEREVGRLLWRELMDADPSSGEGDNLPVNGVSFEQALEFCARFAERARAEDERWEGWTFDLPTEEEWEYACRAGTRTPIAVPSDPGDETEFSRRLVDYAWFVENSRDHPAAPGPFPVAGLQPNAWMLFDMHGNVFEWCDASEALPPPPEGFRVLRGGCYATAYRGCRSSNRDFEPGQVSNRRIGLRLVARPPGNSKTSN